MKHVDAAIEQSNNTLICKLETSRGQRRIRRLQICFCHLFNRFLLFFVIIDFASSNLYLYLILGNYYFIIIIKLFF